MPHADAVKRIAGLPLVSREVMDGLLPELRAYAFCVTGLDSFDQLAKVQDHIKAVPAGAQTWAKARKEIAAEVAKKFKTPAENVIIFNLESKFGGGRASGLGYIYNHKDSLMKFETKYKKLRAGLLEKKTTPTSRRLKKENKNKVKNLRGKAKIEKLKGGDKKKKK